MNPYERIGRLNKVNALTRAIDRVVVAQGITDVAAQLQTWTPAQWSEIANRIGINAPSQKTVRAVIAEYGGAQ